MLHRSKLEMTLRLHCVFSRQLSNFNYVTLRSASRNMYTRISSWHQDGKQVQGSEVCTRLLKCSWTAFWQLPAHLYCKNIIITVHSVELKLGIRVSIANCISRYDETTVNKRHPSTLAPIFPTKKLCRA